MKITDWWIRRRKQLFIEETYLFWAKSATRNFEIVVYDFIIFVIRNFEVSSKDLRFGRNFMVLP